MNWYAAHIVLYVKFQQTRQDRFPIWENIVLIQAESEDEAFAKAEARGRADAGEESFTWEGQPANWVFAGVCKITECALLDDRPGADDEVAYLEMEVDSEDAAWKLARGDDVAVWIRERHRDDVEVG